MTSSIGKLTSRNDCTAEQMGTEQCDLSRKTPQTGSECLDSEQRVLGTVSINSVTDEKSNQVSANVTENSVIQLPEPPYHYLENSCQTVDGSCLQQSTFKQVPDILSDDKSENKCPQNLQNEPGEISDAVNMQSVPAHLNMSSVNELLDPPSAQVPVNSSDDKSENKCPQNLQNEPGERGDAVTGLVAEDEMLSVPAQVNMSSENELLDLPSAQVPVNSYDDKSEIKCPQILQNEPGERGDAVTGLVAEDEMLSVPAQVNMSSENELLNPPSAQTPVNLSDDKSENKCPLSRQNEPGERGDAVTELLVDDQMQYVPAQVNMSTENELLDLPSAQVPVNLSDDKSEIKCPQILQNEPGERGDTVTGLVEDQMQSVPAQVNMSSANELLDPPSAQVPVNLADDKSEIKCPQNLQNEPGEISDAVTGLVVEDHMQSVPAQVNMSSANELLDPPSAQVPVNLSDDKSENKCPQDLQNEPGEISDAVTDLVVEDQMQSVPAQVCMSSANELLDPHSGDVAKNISSNCSERKPKNSAHLRLRRTGKSNSKLLKKKYMLRSLGSSGRALRSRTRDKPKAPEPQSNVLDVNNDEMKRKKGRKKKKRRGEGVNDQFSRIRSHLRYLLNRVSYEQSLIDAYSGEGWKGYSMEKLKPEKEIERAKAEILRRKLKIRDLFQNLDSLCAVGKLPESLFDSEGEIDSEDIFCAKCQSKELSTGNDIILCDGACDRGFHQLCLDPPLLTEDIPPGDEGWLCPGCDCKDDCIELVNDSLGTNLSLSDTWKRVFPEAATAAGSNMDPNLGLPSDGSDDDDYNPNGPEDVEVEGGESSSDESEYASASEKLEDSRHEDQYMGLPSEDSEDDDYDPNARDVDSKVTEESSSSDFTSDSEDLAAAIGDNMSTGQDGDLISASLDNVKNLKGSSRQKGKVGKKPSMADELSSLLEPDPGQEDFTPVSRKRNVERLDYKKLYDETYQSDTSEDEEWTDSATPSRKKKHTGKMAPVSPNGNASNNSRYTPRRNTDQNTNNSPTKSLEGREESGSRDKKPGSSTHKKLGEAVVQRLHKSFKENQYPDRTTKESLAQELGLTFRQVDKWFGNTRWSFRHSSHKETSPGRNALQQATDSRAENNNEERECKLVSQEVGGENSKATSSRKRKRLSEPESSEARPDIDGSAVMSSAGSPRAGEMQTGNKMKTRKRK